MTSYTKGFVFFGLALLLSFSLLSPQIRHYLSFASNPNDRIVLATIDFTNQEDVFKVVKIKNGADILIEIYQQHEHNPALYASFDFLQKKDVFYDFKSSVTNLFIANVDDDDIHEILVPVIGPNLESEIGVIKYSPETKKFAIF